MFKDQYIKKNTFSYFCYLIKYWLPINMFLFFLSVFVCVYKLMLPHCSILACTQ